MSEIEKSVRNNLGNNFNHVFDIFQCINYEMWIIRSHVIINL